MNFSIGNIILHKLYFLIGNLLIYLSANPSVIWFFVIVYFEIYKMCIKTNIFAVEL